MADVLRYRIRLLENGGRTPERAVRDGDWTTFATPLGRTGRRLPQVLATAATARQTELGDRAAATPPAWALAARPSARPRPTPRSGPSGCAAPASSRPTATCTPSPTRTVDRGGAGREREFHHALWRQAAAALGHPADALDYATASDAELREMRDAWRRAQAWEPQFVAADLHNARELAEEYRRDAVIWRAGLDRDPVGSPERELAERDVAAAEHLAAVAAARVEALERIQDVRTDWLDRTRELQERAAFAGDELERRGLDRDTAAPVGEQQELFTIGDGEPDAESDTEARGSRATDPRSAGQTMRGLDPAQHQFDLDGVPPPFPPTARAGAGGHRPRRNRHGRRSDLRRDRDDPQRAATGGPQQRRRPHRPSNRRPRRTGTPSCSPTPNVPPNANASSPPCSRRNPPPSTSRPRSHCTSTTLPAARRRRASDEHTDRATRESATEDSALTVSKAARQAKIIAEMRAELDARAAGRRTGLSSPPATSTTRMTTSTPGTTVRTTWIFRIPSRLTRTPGCRPDRASPMRSAVHNSVGGS